MHQNLINFKDFLIIDNERECLIKYFSKAEANIKTPIIASNYKFHQEIPRIFSKILNNYHRHRMLKMKFKKSNQNAEEAFHK